MFDDWLFLKLQLYKHSSLWLLDKIRLDVGTVDFYNYTVLYVWLFCIVWAQTKIMF